MEEDAEAVHLYQAEEGGATGIAGENRGGSAEAGAQDGEEGEDLAAAREGLEECQEDAEGTPDGFGEDADQVLGLRNHGRAPAFAGELIGRSRSTDGKGQSGFLTSLGMTSLFDGKAFDGKAMPSAAKADVLLFVTARLKSCPDVANSDVDASCLMACVRSCLEVASWGKLRCIWSSTFWEGAAKRRVK